MQRKMQVIDAPICYDKGMGQISTVKLSKHVPLSHCRTNTLFVHHNVNVIRITIFSDISFRKNIVY